MNKNQKYLSKEELESLQMLSMKYRRIESSIGSLEVEKHTLIDALNNLKMEIFETEAKIKAKYGEKCKINLSTGEVESTDSALSN
jgi:hypothetical protein